jgi:hypothetical protein
MKQALLALLTAALVAAPVADALDRKEAQALLRIAVKATGLKAREQVRIVVERPAAFNQRRARMLDRRYPRLEQDHDEAVLRSLGVLTGEKGVLRRALIEIENRTGLYDPVTKTAYIRAGATERTAALHEVVHALQDQHYSLGRVARLPTSDARIAALAAIEGHAKLVTDVLVRRSVSAHGGPKLTRFLELERGFIYAVGLRFAAELRNLGGTKAVLGAVKAFPATSEQVFHLDKYLERERATPIVLPVNAAGATLAGDGTFGELDVRALLAVFGVPRLDHVANGWGGGRSALYRGVAGDTVLIALDWDSDRDAAEWAEAVATFVNEAFDSSVPGPPAPTSCTATLCWQLGSRGIAFARDGERTSLALGTDAVPAAAIANAVLGR